MTLINHLILNRFVNLSVKRMLFINYECYLLTILVDQK